LCNTKGSLTRLLQHAGSSSSAEKPSALKALLTPFSDKAANAKLLALCGAGALSSVATLIHDTYLAIYLSEVLGLSNTKVPPTEPQLY